MDITIYTYNHAIVNVTHSIVFCSIGTLNSTCNDYNNNHTYKGSNLMYVMLMKTISTGRIIDIYWKSTTCFTEGMGDWKSFLVNAYKFEHGSFQFGASLSIAKHISKPIVQIMKCSTGCCIQIAALYHSGANLCKTVFPGNLNCLNSWIYVLAPRPIAVYVILSAHSA